LTHHRRWTPLSEPAGDHKNVSFYGLRSNDRQPAVTAQPTPSTPAQHALSLVYDAPCRGQDSMTTRWESTGGCGGMPVVSLHGMESVWSHQGSGWAWPWCTNMWRLWATCLRWSRPSGKEAPSVSQGPSSSEAPRKQNRNGRAKEEPHEVVTDLGSCACG
jgi:hypothetical protein